LLRCFDTVGWGTDGHAACKTTEYGDQDAVCNLLVVLVGIITTFIIGCKIQNVWYRLTQATLQY